VIVRDDIVEQGRDGIPTLLKYRTHAAKNSLFNTAPCWNIYVVRNILRNMKERGGLTQIEEDNRQKAGLIYDTLDANPDFFRAPVEKESRSVMNIVFRLPPRNWKPSSWPTHCSATSWGSRGTVRWAGSASRPTTRVPGTRSRR
jgi:phosphoserine aminotransferase